jgi:hypothetical protein
MTSGLYYASGEWKYTTTGLKGSRFQVANQGIQAIAGTIASPTAGDSVTQSTILYLTYDNTLSLQGATSTSGTGIAFPATQSASSDANTLDDYEEGTWTPTIRGSATLGTGTYTTQQGTYTKIGNTVRFQAEIVWTAHTGSGQLEVSSYPFTSTAESSPISLSFYGGPTFTSGNFIQAYKNPSDTTSGTAQTSSASSFASVAISNAGTVQVSGVYKVA